jgi:hypothetical protein
MQSYAIVFSVLLSSALLASASVLVSSGQEEPANRQVVPSLLRFLVTPKTITSTVTVSSTNVVFKGITTSCAKSVAGIPNCRKRRSVMEESSILEAEDEEIYPSPPVKYNFYVNHSFVSVHNAGFLISKVNGHGLSRDEIA